jgi:hypothetical protein
VYTDQQLSVFETLNTRSWAKAEQFVRLSPVPVLIVRAAPEST